MTEEEAQNTIPEDITGEKAPDVSDLEKALAEERKKAEDYLASWQRAQADFINYKRRVEQERADFTRFASASLVLALLPVLDDLDRALAAVPSSQHSWLDGIRLIDGKLRSILEAQGVTPIKAVGEPFDPNFHEAIRQDRGKEGLVIEEYQKGYMMHDKLLRPARVVVGNGEEENEQKEGD